MADELAYILQRNTRVIGVFTSMEALMEHVPDDIVMTTCPNANAGCNGHIVDSVGVRHRYSIRILPINETPDEKVAREARWRYEAFAKRADHAD